MGSRRGSSLQGSPQRSSYWSVREFKGDGKLSSIVVENPKNGAVEEMTPGAVFIFIGLDPNTEVCRSFDGKPAAAGNGRQASTDGATAP